MLTVAWLKAETTHTPLNLFDFLCSCRVSTFRFHHYNLLLKPLDYYAKYHFILTRGDNTIYKGEQEWPIHTTVTLFYHSHDPSFITMSRHTRP